MAAKSKVYFHSPFCPTAFKLENNRALLLLLIMKELTRTPAEEESKIELLPFDWTVKASPLQKITEHLSLLPFAFPHLADLIPNLYQNLHLPSQEFVSLLEPFILEYQSNENVLLFLIQHQNRLALKPLLDKISPEGLHSLKEKIVIRFRKRGYPFTRWTNSPRKR